MRPNLGCGYLRQANVRLADSYIYIYILAAYVGQPVEGIGMHTVNRHSFVGGRASVITRPYNHRVFPSNQVTSKHSNISHRLGMCMQALPCRIGVYM